MATKIHTQSTDMSSLNKNDLLSAYNGLDCLITKEVWDTISQQLDPETTGRIYDFERSLQGPVMEMMLRGTRIDRKKRSEWISHYNQQARRLAWIINQYTQAVCGQDINPNSPDQIKKLFYTNMRISPIYKFEKGEKKVSTSEEALNKLAGYQLARPIALAFLKYREVYGKLTALQTAIDSDDRFRATFKIAGTETGRFASGPNPLGTGKNMQNFTDELREIFVADPGMKMAYIDLEQAESRAVAYLSGDENYIEACESGDVHTVTAKMVWPELPWTGNLKEDKKVAEQPFYRHFTYRDMAKRGQHASNYFAKPKTVAKHLHVRPEVIEDFQNRYFKAFPGIKKWHKATIRQLQVEGVITTPVGRRRRFWGRRNDESTWREAIAFAPQSLIADIMNMGLYLIWRDITEAQIMAQVHDAVLLQYPEEKEDDIVPQILHKMEVPIQTPSGVMVIPSEAETGWNWRHAVDSNRDGLYPYTGSDSRVRTEYPSENILDVVL